MLNNAVCSRMPLLPNNIPISDSGFENVSAFNTVTPHSHQTVENSRIEEAHSYSIHTHGQKESGTDRLALNQMQAGRQKHTLMLLQTKKSDTRANISTHRCLRKSSTDLLLTCTVTVLNNVVATVSLWVFLSRFFCHRTYVRTFHIMTNYRARHLSPPPQLPYFCQCVCVNIVLIFQHFLLCCSAQTFVYRQTK